ncbi:MAG TPA: hypothetical protein VFS32_04180 [Candidatus Limnocylindrales bacterium]|nr:hypothetical protein [Candidatus Limnocylindrales bacterium]
MTEEQRDRRSRRQPDPVGRPNDDETDRTDLDMDEPGEGFGVGPWAARDVTREEALRVLSGAPFHDGADMADVADVADETAPAAEGEDGTREVR